MFGLHLIPPRWFCAIYSGMSDLRSFQLVCIHTIPLFLYALN
jgi:hypothetical protein